MASAETYTRVVELTMVEVTMATKLIDDVRKDLMDLVIAAYEKLQAPNASENLGIEAYSAIDKASRHPYELLRSDRGGHIDVSFDDVISLFGRAPIDALIKYFDHPQQPMNDGEIKSKVKFYLYNDWPRLEAFVGDICYWDDAEWDDRRGAWVQHW